MSRYTSLAPVLALALVGPALAGAPGRYTSSCEVQLAEAQATLERARGAFERGRQVVQDLRAENEALRQERDEVRAHLARLEAEVSRLREAEESRRRDDSAPFEFPSEEALPDYQDIRGPAAPALSQAEASGVFGLAGQAVRNNVRVTGAVLGAGAGVVKGDLGALGELGGGYGRAVRTQVQGGRRILEGLGEEKSLPRHALDTGTEAVRTGWNSSRELAGGAVRAVRRSARGRLEAAKGLGRALVRNARETGARLGLAGGE